MSKTRSLAIVTVAYVVAIGVGAAWLAWGPGTGRLWLDTFIADLLATVVIFGFSRAYRNSSFYDAYWSVIPPLLLFYWWSQAGPGRRPAALLAGRRSWCVLWAIRLTANWVYALPRPAPRGLALPDVQAARGPLRVRRRPGRHPPDPDRARSSSAWCRCTSP